MTADKDSAAQQVETAVAEGGAYDLIRKRLLEQGSSLEQRTDALNTARIEEVGSSRLDTVGRVRVRTENNCVARDIVQIGEHLLFGYNVYIGLKRETQVDDVFGLYSLQHGDDGFSVEPANLGESFLDDRRFKTDFHELYQYYKNTRLIELTINNGKLLAGFQIGEKLEDIRVFRWSINADFSRIEYIDNRGERDIQLPPAYDFEWAEVSREDFVNGRHPHINLVDTLFVENLNGTLSFKIENNTDTGESIHSEELEHGNQSLDDLQLLYAQLGDLLLVRTKPYKEDEWRNYVYNSLERSLQRIDAIAESCVQLPEDHGLIYPDGYYLQSGESKSFGEQMSGFRFKRSIRSPNGEDVLFVFYEPQLGLVALFSYNLIDRSLQNPIFGHGYALSESGQLVIFTTDDEPTRVHPMQIWETPFASQEFADRRPESTSFLGRIGNPNLVRGISDLKRVSKQIRQQTVSVQHYEKLHKSIDRAFDAYYWLESEELDGLDTLLREIGSTSELIIDEFEKVEAIRSQSYEAIKAAETDQASLTSEISNASLNRIEDFVGLLDRVRYQRGHLVTIAEYRYIDTARISELDGELAQLQDSLGERTVQFLAEPAALEGYIDELDTLSSTVEQSASVSEIDPLIESMDGIASGLDLLSELVTSLKIDDATIRTSIVERISTVYSKLNQRKASARHQRSELGSSESMAQFSAQFNLLAQSVNNALGMATTPERCDEQLARLLIQLEELESQFGEHEQFLADILQKREEIYDSFDKHKQGLLEDQQRKVLVLQQSAERMLSSVEKRSLKFSDVDQLNTYLVSDPLVLKLNDVCEQLNDLGGNLQADDALAQLKMLKDQALRSLRDKTDIFEDDGKLIKLGPRHKFNVNTESLELSIIPREDHLSIHLSSTQFFEKIEEPALEELREFWLQALDSENDSVYRAEYLAWCFYQAMEEGAVEGHNTLDSLLDKPAELEAALQNFAGPRYREGYEKGVHDHDAALILQALLPRLEAAGGLLYEPAARVLAQMFVASLQADKGRAKVLTTWQVQAESARELQDTLQSHAAMTLLCGDIQCALKQFVDTNALSHSTEIQTASAQYLAVELQAKTLSFVRSRYAQELLDRYQRALKKSTLAAHRKALDSLQAEPGAQAQLSAAWFEALLKQEDNDELRQRLQRYVIEAAICLNFESTLDYSVNDVDLEFEVAGLLGEHKTLSERRLLLAVDSFVARLSDHQSRVVPAYHSYQTLKHEIAERYRNALQLESFLPRPLSSFVRNQLIDQAYLPLIGDNLAKQMGSAGDRKRTDLMGLLMMISPPGYGKTTLMEYVASRLGLIFMKINCPALGHDVDSLDPAQAPNATAAQELEKLNLGLEMGNNVMLYLDDIQHTNPEFLQKFISLCDATRRIEGVWRGDVKTYDLRGRRFCVVMAGNPYTESGEAFKVPDMLANRADIYNLGDILGGMDEAFALSYIENSLTSNPVLAPLAVREMDDVYKLIDLAKGREVATSDLSHAYSGAEVNEIKSVLQNMFVVQELLLKVNQQYIASAAQEDKYRQEPAFKLQGSYRNMNKLAEKISSVMNADELQQLIKDHYLGEAQLLTQGTESNLLKLAELRGVIEGDDADRWEQIKTEFRRSQAIGGDGDDPGKMIATQLADLAKNVEALAPSSDYQGGLLDGLMRMSLSLEGLAKEAAARSNTDTVDERMATSVGLLAGTIENSLFPVLKTMDKKIDIDLRTQEKMQAISIQLRELQDSLGH